MSGEIALITQVLREINKLRDEVEHLHRIAGGARRLVQLGDVVFDDLQPHQILRYKSDDQTWVNRFTALFTGPALTLTVAGGVVDVAGATTSTNIVLLGQGGVADDVDTIDSDQAGHIIVVRRDPTTTITLKDGTGNLRLPADIVLDSDEKAVWLLYTGSNDWIPIAGFGSGATGPVTPHVHAGEDITSGIVADSFIASTITRDTEVFGIVLANDGPGSGLDADLLDGLSSAAFALAVHTHAGEDIVSGTIADARIASTITRDSEVFGIVLANDGAGSGLDADLLDGLSSAAFSLAGHTHSYQPLDGELTAIAGLTSAANKGIMFTGVGTAATFDLTAFALTLLNDAAASNARTTLELGTMAVEPEANYFLLAGRSGGQTAIGGTASGNPLTFNSTSHATIGAYQFSDANFKMRLGYAGAITRTSPAETHFHIEITDTVNAFGFWRNTADAGGVNMQFGKSRTASVGSNGLLSDGDEIAKFTFWGGDGGGTSAVQAAYILVAVDGTPANADMPGRFDFATTPDGSSSPVVRLSIMPSGRVRVGPSTVTAASILHAYEDSSAVDATAGLTVEQDGAGDAKLNLLLTGGQHLSLGVDNSDSDVFGISFTNDLAGKVFRLTSSGNLTISGTFSSGSTPIPAGSATPFEFVHDGTSGKAMFTVTNSSTTATTIIANAAGDVAAGGIFMHVTNRSGVINRGTSFGALTPGSTDTTVFNDGVNTWQLRCNADGSVDFRRTAGTGTCTITVLIIWQ